jgi:tRNA A-37 threonylcarbamoyl transferase component Bud32
MAKLPFDLLIKNITPGKGDRVLICTVLLRHIPRKRRVYCALLGNQKVIAKIYETKFCAKSRLLNEWSKLKRMQNVGLNCPRSLFYGRRETGGWTIVTEYIEDSAVALELYYKTDSPQEKVRILQLLFGELAKLNEAGVFQKDLHLGNFLISDDKVFSLDTASMKFEPHPVDKTRSLRQLAILSWYVPQQIRAEVLQGLLNIYADTRGWELTADDRQKIESYMKKHIRREIKRQLKKTLRSSGRQVRIKKKGLTAVFDKTFYENLDAIHFLSKIDGLMETGQILKSRPTSFLSYINVNGNDIVIKRYNNKGLWHSIRQSLRTSRAKRSWLHGHRLGMLGVNTPKPLAYIEKRIGPLLWKSYVLTGHVRGQNLADALYDSNIIEQKKQDLHRQIRELMITLHNNRITHGDFKPTNFVITQDRVYITDLDAMKVNLYGPVFRQRCSKDARCLERMFSK